MNVKRAWKKFWHLFWKDDSIWGWLFSLVVIIVFIKFIFFPTLNVVTGTSLPLAIVESCSMYHDGNLFSDKDEWWDNHQSKYNDFDINKLEWETFPFEKGFNKGDILFIVGTNPKNLEIGDVIIFSAGQANPIIHRIVEIDEKRDGERTFSTIGDNNNGQLAFEKAIGEEQIVGRAVTRIAPYIGWGKLIFFDWRKSENEQGFCIEN